MDSLKDNLNLDVSTMREDLLMDKEMSPSFSRKMFGYNQIEVDEYIESLHQLLEGAKASFQAEFEQMRSQVSLLTREKESNEKYLEKLKSELDEYKGYHEANRAKIRDLEQFIETLQAKEQDEEGIDELKARLSEMSQKLSQLQEELRQEKAQNAALTSENEALREQVSQLDEQLGLERMQYEYLSGQNEALKNDLIDYQKKLSGEETENLSLKGQIETLSGSIRDLLKENTLLNERISELNVKMQRDRAAVEGSLYSYKQYQRERLEQLKLHLGQVMEVINEVSSSYSKAENYVLASYEKEEGLPEIEED